VIQGPALIERFFAGLFANGLTAHTLDLIALHGDSSTIVAAANWTVQGAAPDGSAATFDGVATHLFERQPGGGLRLKLHTFN